MLKVFAVRDSKADSYSPLVCLPTVGLAMRGLCDAIAKGGPMAQYPEDYNLYELGTFEESSGQLVGLSTPQFIMSALEAVAELRAQALKNQPDLPGVDKSSVVSGSEVSK